MKTISFFGGSNLIGVGYFDGINSKDIYPNIIANQGYNIENYGIGGASSYEIFLSCLTHLIKSPSLDIICIEWNTLTRYRFHPAPDVSIYVSAADVTIPNNWAHCVSIPKSKLLDLQKTLMLIDGDYHRIITLLQYCEILQYFCKLKNIELIMLNGNIPWDSQLFNNHLPGDNLNLILDKYSKNLVDFDNRGDDEILKLLSELRTYFDQINLENWVFIFENIPKLTVDYALDNNHPGPKTMKVIANRILTFLKEKNL